MAASQEDGQEDLAAKADWKRAWLVDLGQAVLIALAVFVAVVLLLVFLIGNSTQGELGTSVDDSFGENVGVTAAKPLGVRVFSARVDPAGTPIDSIPVYFALQTNRPRDEMWLAAIRVDDGHPTYLDETSLGVFKDAFPEPCVRAACVRTYVLVVCWRQPTAEREATVYFGGRVSAVRARGTPPTRVALDVEDDRLTGDLGMSVARTSGCDVVP